MDTVLSPESYCSILRSVVFLLSLLKYLEDHTPETENQSHFQHFILHVNHSVYSYSLFLFRRIIIKHLQRNCLCLWILQSKWGS